MACFPVGLYVVIWRRRPRRVAHCSYLRLCLLFRLKRAMHGVARVRGCRTITGREGGMANTREGAEIGWGVGAVVIP